MIRKHTRSLGNNRLKASRQVPMSWAVAACILGAWAGVLIGNGVGRQWSFATVHAQIAPSWSGWTHIIVPPAGALHARTHSAPLAISLRVEELYIKETAQWLTRHTTPVKAGHSLKTALRQLIWRLLWATLAAALIGATLTAILIRCTWRQGVGAVAAGLCSVAAPVCLAAVTYRTEPLTSPNLSGELARTANFASVVRNGYNTALTRLPTVSRQIADLIQQMETVSFSGDRQSPATSVLVISDLHNNPLAARAAIRMARAQRVHMVLVCGDVTDYGHPLEGELLSVWRQFHIPVIVVLGNHDSRSIGRTLEAIPGVTVLDNGHVRRAAGLQVMGYADPASRRENLGSVDPTERDLNALATRMRRALQRRSAKPDVVMVHNFRVAARLAGFTPVIVTGHSHSASVIQMKGSIIVNPGSTGAAGIRYLTANQPQPHSAAVLRFQSSDGRHRLASTDLIKLFQPSGDFEIRRHHVRASHTLALGQAISQRTR